MVLHLNVGEYVAAFFYKPRSEKIGVSFFILTRDSTDLHRFLKHPASSIQQPRRNRDGAIVGALC